MMHTAGSMVPVWRLAVRTTDDIQATVTLRPVKQQGQTVSVGLQLQVILTLPPQDERLPPPRSRPTSIGPGWRY
jgi:hypothetical protein